jgi:acyl-[acyl-carrier-protein]-phospholipid O-acyltransferase/long-chain-fatty-acid--[acyl-carrier-protein] ligase
MKWFLHQVLRLLFRFRGYHTAALKTPGPVLLIPNHVSWLDWLFLGVLLDDDWRFVTSSVVAQTSWLHRRIMINRRTFPIDTTSPYAVKHMAEYLETGGRLVLFAEGRITHTGSLMKLFDGVGFLIYKTRAKVITAYLRGANRLCWSRQPGWRRWFPRVSAHFSDALDAPHPEHPSAAQGRAILTNWLRDRMTEQQFRVEMEFGPDTVPAALAETARRLPNKIALEDFTLQTLTYRRLFVGAHLLARQLACRNRRQEADPDNSKPETRNPKPGESLLTSAPANTNRLGILLPNANALPVSLLALWSLGYTPAILNFSTGPTVVLACAQLAGLKRILTSRAFIRRAKLDLQPLTAAGIEFIYLEDLRAGISQFARLATLLRFKLLGIPRSAFAAPRPEDTAVILFTSGSEGVPKGVELTHRNLLANYHQMLAVTDIEDSDRVFNALPLFHSFGLSVGTLLGLLRGLYVFLYPSPLHYRVVPTVLYDRRCTIFLSTNTFLNGYARKAHPYDFRNVRYLFAGAEKVQSATFDTWAQRFGIRILEGYGATEVSPVISVNTPMMPRHGSAGRLLPGMEWRVEPVEGVSEEGSGRRAEAHSENSKPGTRNPEAKSENHVTPSAAPPRTGRLFVRGPNVMKGYLNPDAHAKFLAHAGWYDTGDIVRVDEDGYLHILGRLKRFAKVSGEMVSLTAVEDALAGAFPHYGLRCQCAVLAVPDEEKGEQLIAVTNEPRLTADEIRQAIRARGLSNLCVPRQIKVVKEIPKLGTGKVNHRELAKMI